MVMRQHSLVAALQVLVLDHSSPADITCSLMHGTSQLQPPWQLGSSRMTTAGAAAAAGASVPGVPGGGPDRATSWPNLSDLPAAAVHRRTRSSNTQLPPLDEHAVLAQPDLTLGLQPAAYSAATIAAAAAAVTAPAGWAESDSICAGSSVLTSRRSSRADSEASSTADSTTGGGGLVCEPSSFGVCADPAGKMGGQVTGTRVKCW